MHRGYIKLWRKIVDWSWYQDANTLATFIHLIIKCNHKDTVYMGHPVPRGSCVCGRFKLSKDIGLSERSVRTCLEHLKSTNDLTIKTTNKFSIISIANYESYQGETTSKASNKTTFNRPTTDQQPTTSKECKEHKNEKNTTYSNEFEQFWAIYPRRQGKGLAYSTFSRLSLGDGLLDKIIAAVEIQKKSDQWTKEGGQYIPMPATWLNQRRWEDEGISIQTKKKVGPRFVGVSEEMYGKV